MRELKDSVNGESERPAQVVASEATAPRAATEPEGEVVGSRRPQRSS